MTDEEIQKEIDEILAECDSNYWKIEETKEILKEADRIAKESFESGQLPDLFNQ